jgi:hypothetical protein
VQRKEEKRSRDIMKRRFDSKVLAGGVEKGGTGLVMGRERKLIGLYYSESSERAVS